MDTLISHISCAKIENNLNKIIVTTKEKIKNDSPYIKSVIVKTSYLREIGLYHIIYADHPDYFLESTLVDEDYYYDFSFVFFVKPFCNESNIFVFYMHEMPAFSIMLNNFITHTIKEMAFVNATQSEMIDKVKIILHSNINYSLPLLSKFGRDDEIALPSGKMLYIDSLYKSSRGANGFDMIIGAMANMYIEPCGILVLNIAFSHNMKEIGGRNNFILLRSSCSREGIRIHSIEYIYPYIIKVTLANYNKYTFNCSERMFQYVPIPEIQQVLATINPKRENSYMKNYSIDKILSDIMGIDVHIENSSRQQKEY